MNRKVRVTIRRLVPLAAALGFVAAVVVGGGNGPSGRTATPGAPGAKPSVHSARPAVPASHTGLGLPPASERAHRRPGKAVPTKVPRPATKHEQEEVENGEGKNGYSQKLLTYGGGPVQTTPRVYLVFWGSSWTTNGDPYGVANQLHYFYQGVGGSTWANVLKQYGSNYGTFSNPSGQYQGWLRDTTPVPTNPTQADVARVAQRAAQSMNDYSYNAQYVIALPWGVVDQYSTANSFCGWHNFTYVGSSWVTYTSLPYIPYMDRTGAGCGGGRVNGTNGTLDGVTVIAGHEYAETVNDPGLNAWRDADGDENGDKCSWVNLQNRTLANGYTFPVQPTWSNVWRNQYGYGCYFS
jgi:hypothetical protein